MAVNRFRTRYPQQPALIVDSELRCLPVLLTNDRSRHLKNWR
jgi:hypothetical protein